MVCSKSVETEVRQVHKTGDLNPRGAASIEFVNDTDQTVTVNGLPVKSNGTKCFPAMWPNSCYQRPIPVVIPSGAVGIVYAVVYYVREGQYDLKQLKENKNC